MKHPKIADAHHDVLDVIRERWSPRAFDSSKPVSSSDQHRLFEAARWAPSSDNEQPWQFVVADRFAAPDAFAALLGALSTTNQTWAKAAPLLVLVAAHPGSRRVPAASPNRFAWYDTGQAVTLLTIQATSMGLGVRQMAGFDRECARAAVELGDDFEPVVLMTLGYPGSVDDIPLERHRTSEAQPRARRPITDFVKWMTMVMGVAAGLTSLQAAPRGDAMGIGAGAAIRSAAAKVPSYGYKVVKTYPHDKNSFTQGLIYKDGVFFESAGMYGKSNIRKVEVATGKVLQSTPVNAKYFAEGLADWKGTLLQLTWTEGIALVYDQATLSFKQSLRYSGEGWGLTQDGKRLILSDGQVNGGLRFFDPATFTETGRVVVKDNGAPVAELNELEYVNGEVWANVWQTNRIARINPSTGDVVGWIDLSGLLKRGEVTDSNAVLNGIAYDAATNRIFVTGKLWPKLFEITLVPK